ncbi:MATE family efflux transporter, partial [Levilactobacillus parabrevis]|nr:MATE family efflux transporter [Levilactobacillus parabrevis]
VFAAVFMVGAFGYAGAVSAEPLAWLGSCAILVPSWIRAVKQLRNLQRSVDVVEGKTTEEQADVVSQTAATQPRLAGAQPKLES